MNPLNYGTDSFEFSTLSNISRLKAQQAFDITNLIKSQINRGYKPIFTTDYTHTGLIAQLERYIRITNSIVVIGKEAVNGRTSKQVRFLCLFSWKDLYSASLSFDERMSALEIFTAAGVDDLLFCDQCWLEEGYTLHRDQIEGMMNSLTQSHSNSVWIRTGQKGIYSNFKTGSRYLPTQATVISVGNDFLINDTRVLITNHAQTKK
jgi:hypothetical protein